MRITIVSGFFLPVPPLQGGAMEKIWHRFSQDFAAAGHEVTHVSRRWPGLPDNETNQGVRHLRLPGFAHRKRLTSNLALDLIWGLRVLRQLPDADAVICNTVALPVFLRRLKPRAGRVCVSLGRMPKGQTRCYNGVDCLLAPSVAVANRVRQENPKLASRIMILPNPIDWQLHAAAGEQKFARMPADCSPVTLGYVGRIHPEKGLEQFLEAAALLATRNGLPPWRVQCVGPVTVAQGGGGEVYRNKLVEQFSPRLGGRLQFQPAVFDRDKLAQIYGGIDIFCYPSLAAEGEGLSVAPLEAMAAGAVPVVSRLACYDDVVQAGQNGFRFDHSAPLPAVAAEVSAVLAQLILNRTERHRIGRAAQQTARDFDYAVLARAVLERLANLPSAPAA